MKTEDLKGHLLARRANLAQATKSNLANVLLAEARLSDLRGELAASQGAAAEVETMLALVDQPEAAK